MNKIKTFIPAKAVKVEINKRKIGYGFFVNITREDQKKFGIVGKSMSYKDGNLIIKTYNHNKLPVIIEIEKKDIIDNRLKNA